MPKAALKKLIVRLGYDVRRIRTDNRLYHPVSPAATYSPWNKDETFLRTYEAIQGRTLVDMYRCFELWSLVGQVVALDGSLIEIGVWRGGTGALIARKAQLSGMPEPVYLCDTFSGVVKASQNDSAYQGGEHSDTSLGAVELLVELMGLSNVRILKGVFPDETSHGLEKETFRFCHIDVDVYQSASDILAWIWDRMVIGGVIVYDDFGFASCGGITKHVEEQLGRPDRIIVHNLNGHAVVVKTR